MSNRFLLYIAFTLVLFMIWQQWKIEQMPATENISSAESAPIINQDLPEVATSKLNSEKELADNRKTIKKINITSFVKVIF